MIGNRFLVNRLVQKGLFISLFVGSSSSAETVAERVFSSVAPAVVEITALDRRGAGLLIAADGLILTNRHVADSAVLLSVKAKARKRGARETKVTIFHKVKLLAVHENFDLALVKVDAPDHEFAAVDLENQSGATVTGADCFAIGTPIDQSNHDDMSLSISRGIISSAKVTIDGDTFIQTDAPVNPGNSGGPLCASDGRVIGIVTAKVALSDGLGFAVSLRNLKMSDFKKLSKDSIPEGLLEEELARINHDLAIASLTLGVQRRQGIDRALADLASLVQKWGSRPELLTAMGRIYFQIGDHEKASACFEQSAIQNPKHFETIWWRGRIEKASGNRQQAISKWLSVLDQITDMRPEDKPSLGLCLADSGLALAEQGRIPAAFYCLLWAKAVDPKIDKIDEFSTSLKRLRPQALRENPSLADLEQSDAGFGATQLSELMKRKPASDSPDRFSATLGDPNWLNPANSESEPSQQRALLELPEGATDVSIKNPREGMSLADDLSAVVWKNNPAAKTAERVLVTYKLDGKVRYAVVTFPAAEGTTEGQCP